MRYRRLESLIFERSRACSWFRWDHSTISRTITLRRAILADFFIKCDSSARGMSNPLKIWLKYSKEAVKESALKNTHAIVTTVKVVRVPITIRSLDGAHLDCLNKKTTKIYMIAWMAPQITNVQFAPCQSPLTRKTIDILRIVLNCPSLLPPNGI